MAAKKAEIKTARVILNQSIAGHKFEDGATSGKIRASFSHGAGAIIDLPIAEAARYVDKGIASYPNETETIS